jgi:hypothetical protein
MALVLDGNGDITGLVAGALPSNVIGAGAVLQVVQVAKTDTFSSSSSSYTDITGLSVSITPTSSSSKILVMYHLMVGPSNNAFPMVRLVRTSTAIAVGDASGSRTQVTSVSYAVNSSGNIMDMQSMNFLDSPATTSSTTYKLQILSNNGTHFINRSVRDDNADYEPRGISSITVMEIAA